MTDHWRFDVSNTGRGTVFRNGEEVHHVRSAVIRMEAGEVTTVELTHVSCDVELSIETRSEFGLDGYFDYWGRKADAQRARRRMWDGQ